MYDRQKGELKYSPQLGYYYEDDLTKHKKYQDMLKITLIVLALLGIAGGLYWLLKLKESNKDEPKATNTPVVTTPTQEQPKAIQETKTPKIVLKDQPIQKPKTTPKESNATTTAQTNKEEKKNTTPAALPVKTAIKPTKENNQSNTTTPTTHDVNRSEVIFKRGDQKVFFTSMGKSVEGAVIKKNVEEVNLEIDDTQAKEEIKKEQLNNGVTPKKDESKKDENKKDKKEDKKSSAATQTVTVKSGDTIYKIAKKVYGDSKLYKKILQANKIKNNRNLKIGQKLIIPPK
ncbi:MAG: LysM peptidoglycan-binding domain-containing protein [Campylobacterales bacterium]|nr:LysM peptidoglycan-binding domain-containing protein [Campylobacterales bacterium]